MYSLQNNNTPSTLAKNPNPQPNKTKPEMVQKNYYRCEIHFNQLNLFKVCVCVCVCKINAQRENIKDINHLKRPHALTQWQRHRHTSEKITDSYRTRARTALKWGNLIKEVLCFKPLITFYPVTFQFTQQLHVGNLSPLIYRWRRAASQHLQSLPILWVVGIGAWSTLL